MVGLRFGACAFFVAFVCLFGVRTADAALLYLDPSEAEIYRGDTKTVALRIDTDEGECVNTVDAVVTYDASIRAEDISRGNSILKLWVEDPVINEAEHTITFAGGIQNGYCGRVPGDPSLTNIIAEIVFRSPGFSIGGSGEAEPVAHIGFGDATRVLLNDGFGTEAALRTEGAVLTLMSTPGSAPSDEWKDTVQQDTTPPASFAITLARDEVAFSNQFFIAFNSQDKQSGIDHYEVMEEPIEELYTFKWGRGDAPWVTAESPYVLVDQSLNSTIRVKAIDKAGNETIATFVPEEALRSVSESRMLTIGIFGIVTLIVIGVLVYVVVRRQKRIIESYEHEIPE